MKLMIGVLSHDGEQEKRQAILDTWGQDAIDHSDMDFAFLIGKPERVLPRKEGLNLYLPCPDSYKHLPQKTRWFCLWALAHTDAQYLFKADDDTYVHVGRLIAACNDNRWTKPLVGCGGARGTAAPLQGGAGYLLTRQGAMIIAAHMSAEIGSEDRQARGAMLKVGIRYQRDGRFYYRPSKVPTPDNGQITTHRCHPQRMRRIHQKLLVGC